MPEAFPGTCAASECWDEWIDHFKIVAVINLQVGIECPQVELSG